MVASWPGVVPEGAGSPGVDRGSRGEDPEGENPGSVAPERRLRGYTPRIFPLRVLPMAHFHPTFIGSPSLNRLGAAPLTPARDAAAEPRLRCGPGEAFVLFQLVEAKSIFVNL